jgi:ornithine cyclodeaminase/alanine dehydrogenase-like protein (mu-crystallin family)
LSALRPIYLSGAAARRCLPDDDIFRVVHETLDKVSKGGAINGPKAGFSVQRGEDHVHMGCVSGCVPDSDCGGVKWFTASHTNASHGLPRVPATLLLCDSATGLLKGVIDATDLTPRRTAAAAVAVTAKASGASARKAAVVGAGLVGRGLVHFLLHNTAVDEVVVASRHLDGAQRACREAAATSIAATRLRAVAGIEEAVRDADWVFTATGVPEGCSLVLAQWLKSGAVVCTLGSYREIEPAIAQNAARIVVDDPDGVRSRGGLASEIRTGRFDATRLSTVTDLMRGPPPPKRGESRPTLIVMVGMGVLDVALGAYALVAANRLGLGVRLAP